MKAFLWDSESGEPFPLKKDRGYVDLGGSKVYTHETSDEDNGAFVVSGDDRDDRVFTILFLGPKAEENSAKWHKWIEENEGPGYEKASELLKECFGGEGA
jgi:hypothetical protein